MKISIDELKSLPQQRLTFSYKENLNIPETIKPVMGDLTLSFTASGVWLSGSTQTLLKLQCDRCLKPYFQTLLVDVDERFAPRQDCQDRDHEQKERELRGNDFVEPMPDNGILDIDDIVYQAVTLATPTYYLCGPDCPGPPKSKDPSSLGVAPQQAGSGEALADDEPIDPRWKNLKTLFPKHDSRDNS